MLVGGYEHAEGSGGVSSHEHASKVPSLRQSFVLSLRSEQRQKTYAPGVQTEGPLEMGPGSEPVVPLVPELFAVPAVVLC